MMCSNPNLDLVNIYAYTKFSKTLSIGSQDIERKLNYGRRHEEKHNDGMMDIPNPVQPHFFRIGMRVTGSNKIRIITVDVLIKDNIIQNFLAFGIIINPLYSHGFSHNY